MYKSNNNKMLSKEIQIKNFQARLPNSSSHEKGEKREAMMRLNRKYRRISTLIQRE